ncbi:MAG: hypothetical protein Q8934_17095 [Bacillota bacterium]|nr:hypothetical protein [Bacillota bacterium]
MEEISNFTHLKKESYYSFFKKRQQQFGFDLGMLIPFIEENNYPLDTSLDTHFAHTILDTRFREI